MRRPLLALLPVLLVALVLPACSTEPATDRTPAATAPSAASSPASPTAEPEPDPAPAPDPGAVPPSWLGSRALPLTEDGYGEVRRTPRALRDRRFTLADRLPPLPGRGFASRVRDPAPAGVLARSTWQPGCPVGRDELAWVRVAFHGFDGARHTGELLVASAVADDLVSVFRDLWRARFPLEELRITTAAELDLAPTGDGNNSGAFVCRPVTSGTSYSEHALGLAVDLNPFHNPYRRGDVVLPELASAYLDRADVRPGMVVAGGPVVRAFERIGWGWGGAWTSLTDPQHFSLSGG
ncbi:M15 family metallopeptidase [Nocardioides dongkuii]|uniref:M15 family metallopeptidase n=1 Tax=Nocardioides dongkuii TaxID=2760089 RepID=UPI0015F98869|nr:M15 family metallopeptidase [Nocardioides dongkuii]